VTSAADTTAPSTVTTADPKANPIHDPDGEIMVKGTACQNAHGSG
jgi:hypothetical protein